MKIVPTGTEKRVPHHTNEKKHFVACCSYQKKTGHVAYTEESRQSANRVPCSLRAQPW
jgi:hypothetical protein